MDTRKKILYIADTTPFENSIARENLDFVMMHASFEVDVSIVFVDTGILQLLNTEHDKIQTRAFTPVLASFKHYDINDLYVLDTSLKQFKLTKNQLICSVKIITSNQFKDLMSQFDYIF